MGWNNGCWGCAADVEDPGERIANCGDVCGGYTERGGGETDLGDEVADLGGVEVHEAVDVVLASATLVAWETSLSNAGAAEKDTEVLVEMGEKSVLRSRVAVGRHVHHQRSSSASIKEVDGNSLVLV